jgi:pSer/pThr/pTyr-binding forkhead associated (FHA) protein
MKYLFHINEISYIPLQQTIVIGRVSGDINYSDGKLSSKHICIHVEGDQYFIEDLGSKNRTTFNRVEIPPNDKKLMKNMSFIEIGNQQFVFTDRNNLSIEEINNIVDTNKSKQVKKLEGVLLMQDIRNKKIEEITRLGNEEQSSLESVKENENDIILLREEMIRIKQLTDEKIRLLDEEKLKVFDEYNLQEKMLQQQIEGHSKAIQELRLKAQEAQGKASEVKAKLAKGNVEDGV